MSWGVMAQQMGWGSSMEEEWRKGPWTAEEDRLLIEYVKLHGEGRWNNVSRLAGLKRNGKSCRLRWVNYLRPDLKRGQITPHEESIIHELHARWGNRWSTIARSLPGRTDNEIKNYWRTHFKKKDKNCPESPEKSHARLLKRQQFQLQQQQKQQYEQHQLNEADMEKMAALFNETEDNLANFTHEVKQETMYPGVLEEQGFPYSGMNGYANVPETSNEDVMWYGLWNLEDFHGNMFLNRTNNYQHTLAANFC